MSTKPFTFPSVPGHIEDALKHRAEEERKPLDAVVIEALERGLGIGGEATYSDLDFLIGSWQEDAVFDEAIKVFERIDESQWR